MKASRAVLAATAVASATALAMCGTSNGSSGSPQPTITPTPTLATSSPAPTLSPTATPTSTPSSTPPAAPPQVAWGQPFTVIGGSGQEVGAINLSNWHTSTSVNGQVPHFGRFFAVDVGALALEDGFSPSDFDFIAAAGGQVYEQNPLAGGNPLPSQYLTHGQSVSGVLVFDVPADGPVTVLYSPGPQSGVVASWTTSLQASK